MAKRPAFSFYASDFLVDTMLWPEAEVGAWIKILSFLWVNGPQKQEDLYGLTPSAENVLSRVSDKLIKLEDGKISSKKLEEIRLQHTNKSQKAAASANKRWKKKDANAMLSECERNANASESHNETHTITHPNSICKKDAYLEGESESESESEGEYEVEIKGGVGENLRMDLFASKLTEWIKKHNEDFNYTPAFHNDHYEQILIRMRSILRGREMECTVANIIEAISALHESSTWHKDKMLAPKHFANNFDSIVQEAKKKSKSNFKQGYAEAFAELK